jgi:hypothetical protein
MYYGSLSFNNSMFLNVSSANSQHKHLVLSDLMLWMKNKLLLLGYKEILAEVHATDC